MTPEDAAAALLAAAGLSALDAIPIDVLRIAEEHDGLDVQEHADLLSLPGAPSLAPDAVLSGLLFPGPKRIYVNAVEAQRSPGRKNFTIAHELGHWHLHHDAAELGQGRFCRSDDVGGDPRGAPGGDPDRARGQPIRRCAAHARAAGLPVRRGSPSERRGCSRRDSACQLRRCKCDLRR